MGDTFNELSEWIDNGGIDRDLNAFECGECKADDCDDCPKWKMLDKVADQICAELLQLGKKLAKEWLEAN